MQVKDFGQVGAWGAAIIFQLVCTWAQGLTQGDNVSDFDQTLFYIFIAVDVGTNALGFMIYMTALLNYFAALLNPFLNIFSRDLTIETMTSNRVFISFISTFLGGLVAYTPERMGLPSFPMLGKFGGSFRKPSRA
jgi:hypothetical protein